MLDFNIFTIFWNAGLTVKMVLLLLLFFSGYSWYIVYGKFILLKKSRRESVEFLEMFWRSKDFREARENTPDETTSPEALIFIQGYNELKKLNLSRNELKPVTVPGRIIGLENLERAMMRAETQVSGRFRRSLPFLATTGSSTPFIGLFGTVWGIMTSFHEIGFSGSASLAVVAPGISEALIATAAGLFVAIPAVIFYNYFSHLIVDQENDTNSFINDFLNLVEREMIAAKE